MTRQLCWIGTKSFAKLTKQTQIRRRFLKGHLMEHCKIFGSVKILLSSTNLKNYLIEVWSWSGKPIHTTVQESNACLTQSLLIRSDFSDSYKLIIFENKLKSLPKEFQFYMIRICLISDDSTTLLNYPQVIPSILHRSKFKGRTIRVTSCHLRLETKRSK